MDDSRGVRLRWVIAVAVTLPIALFAGCTSEPADPPKDVSSGAPVATESTDGLVPPSVNSTRLDLLDPASRPPEPTQWSQDREPVPFGQWWSGLATGPGVPALWAQPLLLRTGDDSRLDLSAPTYATRPDGFRDATVIPAVFFDLGTDTTVEVVDHGPLHVRFTVHSPLTTVTMTMIQGSPFLEFEGTGDLSMTIPALAGLPNGSDDSKVARFSTAAGPWLLASSASADRRVDGDHVILDLTSGVRYSIGPVAADADSRYEDAALAVAAEPLVGTSERVTVGPDGTVSQVLEQHRSVDAATPVAWSLLPHHEDFLAGDVEPVGSLLSIHGTSQVVVSPSLEMKYPAVPIIWNAVAPAGFDVTTTLDDVPDIGIGSYFGAKHTATQALVHDVLQAGGANELAATYLVAAEEALGSLMKPGTDPELRWEPGWGAVVVTPAEFGAGDQLNDHQLQNGYWVGAAASVVSADPTQVSVLEDGIDLLVADYAGSDVVPQFAGTVADQGTWSPFNGHSWASGIGGFAAGNNLESISESSYAWWAAAKWFLATDRAALAEPFVARLTIESWLTGYEWLPTPDHQSDNPATRPWSGVVWAGKADPGTWFDASDEAALGIRLLPIGPQSFSRYNDEQAVRAALDRWEWCDDAGLGCVERWWNLLDTDAAVAGRPVLAAGDLPEESTTDVVRRWWRDHWETTTLAEGWNCTPGTAIRRTANGALVALVTNASPAAIPVLCTHQDGDQFDSEAAPFSSATVPVE